MRMGVMSRGNLNGLGCDLSNPDPNDPTCTFTVNPTPAAPSNPTGQLPLPSMSTQPVLPDVEVAANCYPSNFVGPIPPGSSYCSTPAGLPTPTGCPAGSTCSIIAGVPNTAVYTLGAVLGFFVFLGVRGK